MWKDILLGVAVALALVWAVIHLYQNKKRGKSCAGCASCPYRERCNKK